MNLDSHEGTKTLGVLLRADAYTCWGAHPPRVPSDAPRVGHVGRDSFKKANIFSDTLCVRREGASNRTRGGCAPQALRCVSPGVSLAFLK